MIFYRINELANKRGKSLQRIAIDLGLGQSYFYNMKYFKTSPSADVIVKVADYFHVSVDYLLGRDKDDYYQKGFDDGMDFVKKAMLESLKKV
ncbi:HTH-type transcriptional regulator Xre [Lactococcus lactis]|uniref:helix-turn-helix domain-containing protein n=1 Tax=Lactococcus lactis TaxID=1358 RepID=UPI00071C76A6|nr:helix-turn-helix transcriptional regulator [Lactococcus lactis]KST79563.1 Transcriptional regulator [Lactococcus lactis subsp. lactis]MDU0411719.1 HTH-type transcriptional regulator Xre [Lactococcus lactis]